MKTDEANASPAKPKAAAKAPSKSPEKKPRASRPSRGPVIATGLFCVLSLGAAAAGGGLLWQNQQQMKAELETEAVELDDHIAAQNALNDNLDSGISDLRTSVAASEKANREVAESIGSLSGQIAELTVGFDKSFTSLSKKQAIQSEALTSLEMVTSAQDGVLNTLSNHMSKSQEKLDNLAYTSEKRLASLDGVAKTQGETLAALEKMAAENGSGVQTVRGVVTRLEKGSVTHDKAIAAVREIASRLEKRHHEFETTLSSVQQHIDAQDAKLAELAAVQAEASEAAEVLAGLPTGWTFSDGFIIGGDAEPETAPAIDVAAVPAPEFGPVADDDEAASVAE